MITFSFASAEGQATRGEDYQRTVLAIQERIQSNDLAGARALLAVANRSYPADGGLDNLEGIIDVQQGNVDGAHHAFNLAVKHSPKLLGAYLNLARLEIETPGAASEQHKDALRLYSQVLQMQPANVEAHLQSAMILMQDGAYEASLKHLISLTNEVRHRTLASALLCADEAALGHKDAASQAATVMIGDPELSEADVRLILDPLRKARRADLLAELFTAAEKKAPLSPEGLRLLGLAQEADGQREQSRATLEKAYSLDAGSVIVLTDLTRIALAQKAYQDALGYLAHARQLAPDNAALAYEFGVVCFKMNLIGEARKAMGEALQLAPESAEYNLGMGIVSTLAQDPLASLPYLKKYYALKPNDPEGPLALGEAYHRAKDFESARPWLIQATRVPSTAARAHALLGSSLRQQGRIDDALVELKESERLDPSQAEVHAEIGQVYLQQKSFAQAEKELQKGIGLDADNYTGNFALMQLYAQTHDPRRAEQADRFHRIEGLSEQHNREAMRVIEIQALGKEEPGK